VRASGNGETCARSYESVARAEQAARCDRLRAGAPPIQGIGNPRLTMQVESRDGKYRLRRAGRVTRTLVADGKTQSALAQLNTCSGAERAANPRSWWTRKGGNLRVPVRTCLPHCPASRVDYVNQINKIRPDLPVYLQADSQYRLRPSDIDKTVGAQPGRQDVPPRALWTGEDHVGPELISL